MQVSIDYLLIEVGAEDDVYSFLETFYPTIVMSWYFIPQTHLKYRADKSNLKSSFLWRANYSQIKKPANLQKNHKRKHTT